MNADARKFNKQTIVFISLHLRSFAEDNGPLSFLCCGGVYE